MLCPRSVLVTGANRGIGLELVRQLTRLEPTPPKHVFAACRNPETATELNKLADKNKSITIIKIDVESQITLAQAMVVVAERLAGSGLNLLINNAGILIPTTFGEINPEDMLNSYRINAVGPLLMAQTFLSLLKKSAQKQEGPMSCSKTAIINISTGLASITENSTGKHYNQRCSKAALNMATKNMSIDLLADEILVAAIHPGWVKTDMGGEGALSAPQESVQNMLTVLGGLSGPQSTGTFYHQNGRVIAW